jgi:hypothetical protein
MSHFIAKTGLFEEKTMQKSPSFPTFNLKPQNPSESGISQTYGTSSMGCDSVH